MFFALLFGIGLVMVDTPETRTLQSMIGGLFEVMMRLIGLVIRLAPPAIACFMLHLAALFGRELIGRLSAYVGVVLLALSLHTAVVYSLPVRFLGRMSHVYLFRGSQEGM